LFIEPKNLKESKPHEESFKGMIDVPFQKEAFSDTYFQLVDPTVANALKTDDCLCRAPEEEIRQLPISAPLD